MTSHLYPVKLHIVHSDPPHPLIEVRRLCIQRNPIQNGDKRRQDSANDDDHEQKEQDDMVLDDLYNQMYNFIHQRKPSRNRLAKYVIKRVEALEDDLTLPGGDSTKERGDKQVVTGADVDPLFDRAFSSSEHHDQSMISKVEFSRLIATADYRSGGSHVATPIRLRVMADMETDEEALVALLAHEDPICADAIDLYDEYLIPQVIMEEMDLKHQSSVFDMADMLKKLPELVAMRLKGIYEMAKSGLMSASSSSSSVAAAAAAEQAEVQDEENQHVEQLIADDVDEIEQEQVHVQEEEEEEDEVAQEEEHKDEVAVESDIEVHEKEQEEQVLDEEDEEQDVVQEDIEVKSEEEAQNDQEQNQEDSSILDSFVVVGKGGQCLDELEELAGPSSQSEEEQGAESTLEQQIGRDYADKLRLMFEMGFEDEAQNRELLIKHDGDLAKVVRELMGI